MTTPILQIYNLAQSFFLDAETVKGAKTVGISCIELFFRQKPNPTGNKSGLIDPGVVLFICETDADKRPLLDSIISGSYDNEIARVEYADISTSSDASRGTKFKFKNPVNLDTNKEYAFVVKFDGNENFILWSSKQGDNLLGTNKSSPGPSGKFVGNYYTTLLVGPTVAGSDNVNSSPAWKFLSDTDLKFRVYVARYSVNGNPIGNTSFASTFSANTVINYGAGGDGANVIYGASSITFKVGTSNYEYITYDRKNSKPQIKGGERIYQNTVFWPGGSTNGVTVGVAKNSYLVVANTLLPNGQSFNWNNLYTAGSLPEYIVVVSLNDGGAGKRRTDIRKIVAIESDTVLRVDEPFNFTNSVSYFIKSPVGQVDFIDKSKFFDLKYKVDNLHKKRTKQDLLVLKNSNANSSFRFVQDTALSITITDQGASYSNTDYIAVFGYEDSAQVKGNYPAIANIVTNSSGNITAIHLSNVGSGFVNTGNVKFVVATGATTGLTASSANNSSGSGATLGLEVGSMLRSEFDGDERAGGYFANCRIINLEISEITPQVNLNNPAGTVYNTFYYNPYYMLQNSSTNLGVSYFVDNNLTANRKPVKMFQRNSLDYKNIPVMPSRSNEFSIVDPSTGNPNTTAPASGGGVLELVATSNNDYVCIQPEDITLTFSRFNINNDYTGENKDYGNADSKHITTKVNFPNGRFAEDLLVYLTAYRPFNTDIKVFSRIHNSKDPEAFDDKDWTMMELRTANIYSSSADSENYIEMEFGFSQSPNTAISLAGSINVENTSTLTVIGSGTSFSTNATANLQVNDLVKIYSPLFPNSYSLSVVTAVTSDTQLTIAKPITDAAITGNGLKMDLIGRVGNNSVAGIGYPLQAFNNKLNDNVVRYFNSSMVEYDTYDSMQIKIVLLSDIAQVNSASATVIPTTIPRVDDIRAVGVTA